jgi:hypothetical protein
MCTLTDEMASSCQRVLLRINMIAQRWLGEMFREPNLNGAAYDRCLWFKQTAKEHHRSVSLVGRAYA